MALPFFRKLPSLLSGSTSSSIVVNPIADVISVSLGGRGDKTLPPQLDESGAAQSLRIYSEDDIFAAGWARTSGGALFFHKMQGRTLLCDDELPRGWAYSKASLTEGGAKTYENLVTGECRCERPSSALAAPKTSRANRSIIISKSSS